MASRPQFLYRSLRGYGKLFSRKDIDALQQTAKGNGWQVRGFVGSPAFLRTGGVVWAPVIKAAELIGFVICAISWACPLFCLRACRVVCAPVTMATVLIGNRVRFVFAGGNHVAGDAAEPVRFAPCENAGR